MACVAIGVDNWSSHSVNRVSGEESSTTTKFQGTYKRCVKYDISSESNLNLVSDQLPSDSCMAVSSVNCSAVAEQGYLPSGQDIIGLNELENVDNEEDCEKGALGLLTNRDLLARNM